jgi:hypothetical protein
MCMYLFYTHKNWIQYGAIGWETDLSTTESKGFCIFELIAMVNGCYWNVFVVHLMKLSVTQVTLR